MSPANKIAIIIFCASIFYFSHDLEGYAIAATKNQVFEAILIMMLRSLQAISRAFFMINLPSRVFNLV
jgi:hypothetical protein